MCLVGSERATHGSSFIVWDSLLENKGISLFVYLFETKYKFLYSIILYYSVSTRKTSTRISDSGTKLQNSCRWWPVVPHAMPPLLRYSYQFYFYLFANINLHDFMILVAAHKYFTLFFACLFVEVGFIGSSRTSTTWSFGFGPSWGLCS